jgi:hypothetical protein
MGISVLSRKKLTFWLGSGTVPGLARKRRPKAVLVLRARANRWVIGFT